MLQTLSKKLSRVGCSPRCSQMVPKWHLDGKVAGSDFFNTRARCDAQKSFRFRRERSWVDSACLEMQGNVCLKLWGIPPTGQINSPSFGVKGVGQTGTSARCDTQNGKTDTNVAIPTPHSKLWFAKGAISPLFQDNHPNCVPRDSQPLHPGADVVPNLSILCTPRKKIPLAHPPRNTPGVHRELVPERGI